MFSYKPLLRLLVEKDMTKTQLREATGMSMNTLAKISKNEYVSMSTLDSICKYFHCKIEDIIEFIEWFILCHLTHDWSHECAVTPQSNNLLDYIRSLSRNNAYQQSHKEDDSS